MRIFIQVLYFCEFVQLVDQLVGCSVYRGRCQGGHTFGCLLLLKMQCQIPYIQ